jgi:hypothetical protein
VNILVNHSESAFDGLAIAVNNGIGVKTLLLECGFDLQLRVHSESTAVRNMLHHKDLPPDTRRFGKKLQFIQDLMNQEVFKFSLIDSSHNKAEVGTKISDAPGLKTLRRQNCRAFLLRELEGGQYMLNSLELVPVLNAAISNSWLNRFLWFTTGLLSGLMCRRRRDDKPQTEPTEDQVSQDIEVWMKLRLVELQAECAARSLPKSGNKTELTKRLAQSSAGTGATTTEEQRLQLRRLEEKTGTKAKAAAYVLAREARHELTYMQSL